MKVYLASRFRTVQSVNEFAGSLEAEGHEVVSTWHRQEATIQPLPKPETGEMSDYSIGIASRELDEIESCEILIVLSEDCESTPGGLWFEAGYAKGRGKAVYVHGPRHNIFCHLMPNWNQQ